MKMRVVREPITGREPAWPRVAVCLRRPGAVCLRRPGVWMKGWVGGLILVVSVAMFASGAHAVQDRAAVQAVRVSPDTVELGDPFTLHAIVYVPPGRELRVPATLLPEWGVESLRRVRTDVIEAGDGSIQVALEYDLVPLEIGLAATPQLEMSSGETEEGGRRVRVKDVPGGNTDPVEAAITQITQNTQSGTRTGERVGADGRPRDRLVIAGRRVFVTSPILLDDIAQGLQPRPPADVVGFNWNVPAVLGASLLSLLLLGVVTVQAREWLAASTAPGVPAEAPPETPEEWRERALAELDRLLARGHHRAGRLRDFYEGGGNVIRAYLAHFDPAWSRSRTSTELMRDLAAARGWPDLAALAGAMGRGEVAKFAAAAVRESGAGAAERDWATMRAWVDASGQAPAFARMRAEIAGEGEGDGGAAGIEPNQEGSSGRSGGDIAGGASSTGGPR